MTRYKTPDKGPYPFQLSPSLGRELSGLSFDAQTGELLDHYTNVMSLALDRIGAPSVWRVSMLQMGLAYPFLISGIAAISALHLATLLPHRKYELQNLAVKYESAALPSFRASICNPSADSIHATFAFAGSVVYYIMGLPERQGNGESIDRCRIPSKDDTYPHWFQTIRGLMALLANNRQKLSRGPFAPLLNDDNVFDCLSDESDDQLARLEEMLIPTFPPQLMTLLSSTPPSKFGSSPAYLDPQDARKAEISKTALKELRKGMKLLRPPNRARYGEASIRVWPGSISQDFMELIYERNPRALVILAHYCVLLKKVDHVWYLRGLGQGLLENIWEALGEEWRPWIQWPMDQPVC